ncbi:bifunctional glutamate/proline--tRNA ligase isoform X4 [Pararge aegeria]|uniref:bifunctional glutamate/proline--tRNA ligase isoform X4 n=1 Tax=Pararge aegeria TaxID=116150 RepID=UPI0019D106AD|nr:bifunctional glutamate/proline--tRNA ligase isoform X4 [Pararge aegeria]
MKILCNKLNPPLGGLLAAELYKTLVKDVELVWSGESSITLPNSAKPVPYGTSNDLIRIIENAFNKSAGPLQRLTMNHWLSFSLILEEDLTKSLEYLDKILGPLTYLVGETLSVSDLAVFSILYASTQFKKVLKTISLNNVQRWMKLVEAQEPVSKALLSLPNDVVDNLSKSSPRRSPPVAKDVVSGRLQEGKFIDLPHAEMGKVVVRFPPEASGFLHIGHAKAALLNQYYQQAFEGKLIMRFDDTNPAKENADFEKVILEDVEMLEIKPEIFTHTSQYFDLMQEFCEKLIKEGKAFVDDTPPEQMKNEREQKIESKNRSNSVEKNLQLWGEMKKGSQIGVRNCVRAKIDMQSTNGCLRDPTIYRCKPEEHPRTGTSYKVYPTYDFACPIVDSIEGVTHVLRTMEYHDRDPQFYWFIDSLGLRKPYIWEYSRLSMTNTVLSKRKLTWFVEQGLVDGWDDPRMPTVRGVLRRGMTVEGLRQFIQAQGSSRSVVFMEWDKIWAINKKVIDPIAPRFTALETSPVPVNLKGVQSETSLNVQLHPKNPDVGTKAIWISKRLLIDQLDAKALKVGENATFINYGNVMIDNINRTPDGTVTSIDATPNLENKDFKKTIKLTWLAETPQSPTVETYCVYFDHIISKPLLGKDEDFKQYIGHQTRWEVPMLGESALSKVKVGDIIELQRRGFFRVDVAAGPPSPHTSRATPLILFHVPDGRTKEKPKAAQPPQVKATATVATPPIATNSANLNDEIVKQGDLVRSLKSAKADKAKVDVAVKGLLDLKAKYKAETGQDWKPGAVPAPVSKPASGNDASTLNTEITKQGDLVRSLKTTKADKAKVDEAVKTLLELKTKYKAATGQDWKPGAVPAPVASPATGNDTSVLNTEISKQGDLVRSLKAAKSEKAKVDEAVKTLLDLKTKYKAATGQDWKPGVTQDPVSTSKSGDPAMLDQEISKQGDLVRSLKSSKADKAKIDEAVKVLLDLKTKYKTATGQDWKPGAAPAANVQMADDAKVAALLAQIATQGDKVRKVKAEKAEKGVVDVEVTNLLNLKAQFKALTGSEWTPKAAPSQDSKKKSEKSAAKATTNQSGEPSTDAKPKPKKAEKAPKPTKPVKEESSTSVKKITRLGLEASKETDLPEWYSQVITKSEMIDYYDISGCYILRPWSYSIWDVIRNFLSTHFRKLGVKDGYFPIFVSKAALEREKDHIADFAPEVAWVTHSGSSELAEHIAIRPTSETVMYPAYAKWIQSHRDLPYKLNQWNNVVRWEFKQPQPFLRTREFLWQEGHTAFRTQEEAAEEVLQILDLYARVYEELLAIPVIKGRKTEKEKFAGGDYTTTVEAYIPASGRGIQGATSHHLGQNFSKMFEIVYDDAETQEKNYVYQNSWGLTTRTIGVMVLVHGDDRGLVLPPRVAEIQAIVVPCGITASSTPEERKSLIESCKQLVGELTNVGIRAEGDYRDNYSPGWKFNHWELKGVPIRVELGPKDMARGEVVAVQRLNGDKMTLKRTEAPNKLLALMDDIHDAMLAKATKERDARVSLVTKWDDFVNALEQKHMLLAPFCGLTPCEDSIKNDSARTDDDPTSEVKGPAMGAKSLCIPFSPPRQLTDNDRCIHPACNSKPKFITLFGRSY